MNTNILRATLLKFKELEQQGKTVEASAIGTKGLGFLNRLKAKTVSQVTHLGDTPHLEKLIGAIKVQLDLYSEGKISAVYLAFTRFVNTMKQEAVIEQLLPLSASDFARKDGLDKNSEPVTPNLVGLHLRAGCADRRRRTARALCRSARVSGSGGKHGIGAIGSHGRHEGCFG